jgi:hypothetical protein
MPSYQAKKAAAAAKRETKTDEAKTRADTQVERTVGGPELAY